MPNSPVSPSLPRDLRAWTKTLVQQYKLHAGERLGQHFLVDHRILQAIVQAAAPEPGVPVLEAGGGFGVLTLTLIDYRCSVVTIELDARLAASLSKLAIIAPQLTVLEGDAVRVSDAKLRQAFGGDKFDVVANLPYEISGAFLRRFLGGDLRPRAMTLLLQREVGERLTAARGSMSLLSLLAELACSRREIVRIVPPSVFWPQPRVTSCLVHLKLRSVAERRRILDGVPEETLWRLARIGFAARRKLLKNNLASALPVPAEVIEQAIIKAGLPRTSRAQELDLAGWLRLARVLDGSAMDLGVVT